MLLAIDTSSRQASVALYHGERGVLAETTWHSANRHTEELLPAVDALLRSVGGRPADLRAVAVAIGPGSFTGLRVGVAAAKGLALAGGLALLGIPSLDITAFPHQCQAHPVIAIIQAGRGRLYWAQYGVGPAGWAAQTPYGLADAAELAAQVQGPALFVGELTAGEAAALAQALGDRARWVAPALALRRAGYLAELAWPRLAAGERHDAATLSPIYLQQPQSGSASAAPPKPRA